MESGTHCRRTNSVRNNVQTLQRRLYRKAKQEPGFRFYSLYDKVCRRDVLLKAFDQVRVNKGGSGVDGVSIEGYGRELSGNIEILQRELRSGTYRPQAIKRVYIPKSDGSKRPLGIPTVKDRVVQTACKLVIEPVFEADFDTHSYGFRPKRGARQAVEAIGKLIRQGYTEVLDADIRKYFDTIPHDKLIEKVRRRISDRGIIRLIKSWLMCPVAEATEESKWRIVGGKANKRGTPQGGVISPLLANIYLHELDDSFYNDADGPGKVGDHILIRYADDFIVLSKQLDAGVKGWIKRTVERMGLALHPEKTRQVNVRKGFFTFLGFKFSYQRSLYYRDSYYLVIEPSEASLKALKLRIRSMVNRWCRSGLDYIIRKVNKILIGWEAYFGAIGYPRRIFRKVNAYLLERFYFWSRHLSQRKSKCFKPGVYAVLRRKGLKFL